MDHRNGEARPQIWLTSSKGLPWAMSRKHLAFLNPSRPSHVFHIWCRNYSKTSSQPCFKVPSFLCCRSGVPFCRSWRCTTTGAWWTCSSGSSTRAATKTSRRRKGPRSKRQERTYTPEHIQEVPTWYLSTLPIVWKIVQLGTI